MNILFPKEQALLNEVLNKNSEPGKLLKSALEKIYIHLPSQLLHEKYDARITEEFILNLVRKSAQTGIEKYLSVVTEDETAHTIHEKCVAPGELYENLFKALGSYGVTRLIRDVLQKMAEAPFGEKEIENIVQLIETRNKMRQNEEKFLEKAFRAYLQKQISLYSE